MSVIVDGISKTFGQQKALDNVSFSIDKGEVVGFLGPNGAGKSTMMKIATGYLTPDSGKVEICGIDVATGGKEVRRLIGYLPEHNPLYLSMYVREYLSIIAGMYDVVNVAARVDDMIDLTGLGREAHKRIGALSKGYRQRVGIAQALIGNPEVVILDEPTTGLDPNQIVEIRELIRNVGHEHTLMLSTHIMQEVEAVCDSVIIIDRGKIKAHGKTAEIAIKARGGETIEVEFNSDINTNMLCEAVEAQDIESIGNHTYKITHNGQRDIRADVFKFAVSNNYTMLGMRLLNSDMETLFHEVTKEE